MLTGSIESAGELPGKRKEVHKMKDIMERLRWKAMRAIKDGDYRHLHEVKGMASMAYQLKAISLSDQLEIDQIIDEGPTDRELCIRYCTTHPECGEFIRWARPGKIRIAD